MAAVALPADEELQAYDGWCLELVNELLGEHHNGSVLYVEPQNHDRWRYHAALVLEGLVYDAWFPTVRLPPAEYVAAVFGPDTPWEIIP